MHQKQKDKRIYLDYQATTPTDSHVLKAMLPYYEKIYGNPHSHHHAIGWDANKATEDARRNVAELINADAHEIIFTSGATEANNMAIIGIANKSNSKRKLILVSEIEHKCVLNASYSLVNNNYTIKTIPTDHNGIIDMNALSSLLNENVLLVSVMLANNEIGSIQPIKTITEMAHSVGAIMHTDAAQGPTTAKIDVEELGIDLLSLSAHKMYGPKEIGALYVKNGIEKKLQPIIWGGGQEKGLRSGTLATPLCVGFGEASRIMSKKRELIFKKTRKFRDLFYKKCQELNIKMQLIGPSIRHRHAANLSILFEEYDAEDVISIMQPNLAVSTGSACSSITHETSHVLDAIRLSSNQKNRVIRFSFGKELSVIEVKSSIEHLRNALQIAGKY